MANVEEYFFGSNRNILSVYPNLEYEEFFILRNPFNMIASRIKLETKFTQQQFNYLSYIVKQWVEYARHYQKNQDRFIIYDKWFVDKDYRDRIANRIGFLNEDKGLNEVHDYAGGSSFDKLTYHGQANKMDVLNRYKAYENLEFFKKLFTDDCISLAAQIFGLSSIPQGMYNGGSMPKTKQPSPYFL